MSGPVTINDFEQWRAIEPLAAWIWVALAEHADADGWLDGTSTQLAAHLGVSVETLRRVLRSLEAVGLVRYRRRGSGRQYGLNPMRWPGTPPIITARHDSQSPQPVKSVGLLSTPNTTPLADAMRRAEESAEPADPPTAKPPADASRLVHQHADSYTARFGQPFPVAWARDTQIYKRLVRLYGVETVDALQAQYLTQPLDSFAGKRGFSVPQFAAEIAGFAAQASIRERLTDEQAVAMADLTAAGLPDDTALALAAEQPVDVIREQLQVHRWRQQQGQPVSARRLERAIKERWAIPDLARPVEYPTFPIRDPGGAQAAVDDPAVQAVLGPLMEHITVH